MLWFVDSDDPIADLRFGVRNDPDAAARLAQTVVGDSVLIARGETTLDRAATTDDEVSVGVFGRIAVVVGAPVATDFPSQLPDSVIGARPAKVVHLVVTDLERSFGAFASWENGTLRRSFASNPVDISENIGLPYVFEREFWAGERPLRYSEGAMPDPQALPFHPTEFADHASTLWVGLRLTPPFGPDVISPEAIPVSRFAIRPPGHQPTADDLREPRRPEPQIAPPQDSEPEAGGDDDVSAPTKVARWFGFGRR
ncbi:MAG: hypothetical protein INR72_03990 [Williamsia herbipolensis]|nr:hypothetical protein [Williamsia herbipolensis]